MIDERPAILALATGGIVGALIGAVAAANVAIYFGPDEGYESSLGDLYDHSPVLAVVVVAVLVAGPINGVVVAGRVRKRQSR